MPFASTSSAPNFELLVVLTTAPVPVAALVDAFALVGVFALVFGAAALDPEEPQAAKPSRATGSNNNRALRPELDERR